MGSGKKRAARLDVARHADGNYHAIWGAATDDIYAVGSFGFIAHYDGTHWTEERGDLTTSYTTIHNSSADNSAQCAESRDDS